MLNKCSFFGVFLNFWDLNSYRSSDKTSLLNALAMMDKAVDDSMEVLPWNIYSDDKVTVKNYKNDLKELKR